MINNQCGGRQSWNIYFEHGSSLPSCPCTREMSLVDLKWKSLDPSNWNSIENILFILLFLCCVSLRLSVPGGEQRDWFLYDKWGLIRAEAGGSTVTSFCSDTPPRWWWVGNTSSWRKTRPSPWPSCPARPFWWDGPLFGQLGWRKSFSYCSGGCKLPGFFLEFLSIQGEWTSSKKYYN